MSMLKESTSDFTNGAAEDLDSFVKRLGCPASTILLNSNCQIFRIPEVDGIIGYQQVKNCAVVIGDPICLPQDIPKLTEAFQLHCKNNHLSTIYFLVSHSFALWAIQNGCDTLIQSGEELIIDPSTFQTRQKLRWKINQSIHHGVVIKEYTNFDHELESEMKNTIDTWLKANHKPQIHLGDLNFFLNGAEKRIFYAMQNNEIIGLLKLSPIDRFRGWVLNSFLAISKAPVGTTEHLVSYVFETLAKENCHFLCLGAISGSRLGEIVGLSPLSKFFARLIFKISKRFFHLDRRKVYLNKFHPTLTKTYFVSSEKLTLSELMALKHILNVKICFQ